VTFRLPARIFTDPLARALIEQRQNLATSDAAGKKVVAATLDALSGRAGQILCQCHQHLYGIRAAYWGLREARAPEDITHVEDLCGKSRWPWTRRAWRMRRRSCGRLQSAINQALAMHAPQEVVDKLLDQYTRPCQRYMQALANNPEEQSKQAQEMPVAGHQDPDPEDLEDL